MYLPNFFNTQKRTNRSLARTNKACTDLKNFQQIFHNLWWYPVVFGSKSVLLGVLLIKNSTFKTFFSEGWQRQERLLLAATRTGLFCSRAERWEESSMRWASEMCYPSIYQRENRVFNKIFGQFNNWTESPTVMLVIFMKHALDFAKCSEELSCVKVDFLHISKSNFLEKTTYKTLPNTHYFFDFKKRFLSEKSANKLALY